MAFGNGPKIVTDVLTFVVDAADKNSYPGSGTTWVDLSRSGRNGTLTNGPTFDSANGGSIVFDGVDDYVSCDDIATAYLTLSVWVYKTSTTTNQGICGRNSNSYTITQINNTLQVYASTAGTFSDTGYVIPLNEWINIVFTYSGTGLSDSQTVYINGTNIFSSAAGSGALPTGRVRGGFFAIGLYTTNSSYWGGRISQVQVYGRALSASEVTQNYNAQKSRFGL
jgi:hypothetical protein